MNTAVVTNGKSYLPGIGFDDPSLAETPAYLGADLIGTTRRISGTSPGGTGQGGTGVSPVIHRNVLTAFGEPIAAAGTASTRYTYASTFGYETPEQSYDPLQELGWLHVGERYYDPAVGRFMQRDTLGIFGGLNVYTYTNDAPTIKIDPNGTSTWVPTPGGLWVPPGTIPPPGPPGFFSFGLKRIAGGTIISLCIVAAIEARSALNAMNTRTAAAHALGTPLPPPSPWAPWNWGINSDSGFIRSPWRWIVD